MTDNKTHIDMEKLDDATIAIALEKAYAEYGCLRSKHIS